MVEKDLFYRKSSSKLLWAGAGAWGRCGGRDSTESLSLEETCGLKAKR